MKLIVSTKNNNIYLSNVNKIFGCWSEYKMNYDSIQIQPLKDKTDIVDSMDCVILVPFTHIVNIWHLIHHLFICYKFMKTNNINTKNMYPIFFAGFFERQGELLDTPYNDLVFEGMGFNYDTFKNMKMIFNKNKTINVNNINICNGIPINFNNEPLLEDFKNYVFDNFKLKRKVESKKNILFILRRGKREITNTNDVKQGLANINNIDYAYLEDHSIKAQIEKYMNADIVVGVHGAGLAWCVFMKKKSLLIELYPGNSNTDNYIRWCNIAGVNYKRICVNITNGNVNNFREATVNLNGEQINLIKSQF
jgi:hypothetical protein